MMNAKLFADLVTVRRHLHENPELSFSEFKTAAFVEDRLAVLGISTERVAVTGVIGTLTKGAGPTVVLRADMDALPVAEQSGVEFVSRVEGLMHACGHDIHTTMLLGAATVLSDLDFSGTIKFVFQPAEESPMRSPEPGKSGGQLIMESGQLAGASAVLGLHVHPLQPVGSLSYRNGEALANVGNFSIRILGKGGHPGWMKQVVDPIAVSARIINSTAWLVGPQPEVPKAVFAVAYVSTGSNPTFNVIPSEVLLQGSLRAWKIADYRAIVARLEELLRSLEAEFGCTIELDFSAYYPSLLNDEVIHSLLEPVIGEVFGEQVSEGLGYLVGEDFSFYSRAMPGQFYFLGARHDGHDAYFLHHPKVVFDERCIEYGVNFLSEGALRLLTSL